MFLYSNTYQQFFIPLLLFLFPDGDILKKLLVTGDLLNRLKETNLSPNSEKEEEEASRVPVRDFQLRIMAINNATKASTDGKPFNTPSHLKGDGCFLFVSYWAMTYFVCCCVFALSLCLHCLFVSFVYFVSFWKK